MLKVKEIEPLDMNFDEAIKAVVRDKTSRDRADRLKEGQPDSPTAQQPNSPTAQQQEAKGRNL